MPTAYAAQASLLAMLAASIAWLWHSDAAFELKAAALALGSLLATPYVLDYDLVVLAVAIAFRAARIASRFSRFRNQPACRRLDRAAAVSQHRRGTYIPLGLFVELAFYAFILRRAALDRASYAVGVHGVAQA